MAQNNVPVWKRRPKCWAGGLSLVGVQQQERTILTILFYLEKVNGNKANAVTRARNEDALPVRVSC